MKMKWRIALCLSLPLLALSMAGVSPRPAPGPETPPTFGDEMSYFVEPVGRWRAKNPRAGRPGEASAFQYEFAWDMRKRAVTLRISGVFANGSERPYWLYVYSWNPRDQLIQLDGFGSDGRLTEGTHTLGDKWTFLDGLDGSGASFTFKEMQERLGADAFLSTTFDLRPQGYVESSSLLWERQQGLSRR